MNALQCLPYLSHIDLLKVLLPALIALAGVAITAVIAYRQYLVARAKLNLDLFEQRLQIFDATWSFLSSPFISGIQNLTDINFTNMIPKASFLFGPEIELYMREASKKVTELRIIEVRTTNSNNIVPPELIERRLDLEKWFLKEASEGVKRVFGPYLEFQKWK